MDNDTAKEKIAKVYEILGGKHDWRKWKRNATGILSGEGISKWLGNLKTLVIWVWGNNHAEFFS